MIEQNMKFGMLLRFKLMLITLAMTIFSICALYAVPYFLDANKYSQILIKEIGQQIGSNKVLIANSNISINPFLNKIELNIQDFFIKNSIAEENSSVDLFYTKTLTLSIKITDFFMGNHFIRSLLLDDAYINVENLKKNIDINSLIKKIKSPSSDFYFMNQFIVKNSVLKYNNSSHRFDFDKLNLDINNENGLVRIEADGYDKQKKITSISATIDAKNNSNLHLIKLTALKDSSVININGDFSTIPENENFIGSIEFKLVEPSILSNELVIVLPFLKPMLKDKLKEPLTLTADLYVTKANFDIKNIKMTSSGTNGSGNITFSNTDKASLYCELDFVDFNFNNFFNIKKAADESDIIEENLIYEMNNKDDKFLDLSFLDKIQLSLKLNVNNMSVNDAVFKDVVIKMATKDDLINEGEISFYIDNKGDNSRLMLSNLKLDNINNYNFIIGDFIYEGNNINNTLNLLYLKKYIVIDAEELDYKINSKIIFTPKEISLFDISGKLGKNGVFTGNIATIKDNLTNYNLDIKFENLKINDFNMPLFEHRAKILLDKSDDDNYYSYFRWFRTLYSTYNLRFEFSDTEFSGEKITKFTNSIILEPGVASFKGEVESDFANGNYDINLMAKDIIPKLSVNIQGDSLNYNLIDKLFLGFMHKDNVIEDKSKENQIKSEFWSSEDFKLFKIQKINSNFDIQLKNIQFAKQNIENYKFNGHTSGDIFYVDNLYFNIFGGTLQTRGNISFFDNVLYQFSLNAVNINTRDLFTKFIPDFKNLEGSATITGSFITKGNNPKELISNFSASGNFAAPELNINGIDADVLVDVALKRQNIDKNIVLDSIEAVLHNGNTVVMNTTGSFAAKDGIFKISDTSFRTRFSNAAFVMSLDLNNMLMSSDSKFLFMPYNSTVPIVYSIAKIGSLTNGIKTEYDTKNLLDFVKNQYNIPTQVVNPVIENKKEDNGSINNIDQEAYLYLYKQLKSNQGMLNEKKN